MSRKAIGWSVAAAAVALLAIFYYLPGFVADSIYKNVDDISDGEMPPTVTSFQSGPEIVGTVGGSGEGLNCSLPPWTNILFDGTKDAHGKRHLVLQRFRQACVFHDLCYRHGLATCGYNQNDCDRILQNEAFRLCLYVRNGTEESSSARCQKDSKLVLAGVSIGGSTAYRAWDRSTYFEFESDPSRSNGFQAGRVVDHPFKSVDPVKYRDESDQVILMFENVRSSLTVTCVTCARVPIFAWTREPNEVSPELRSVGINRLPEALLARDPQMLNWTTPVWLPPRRRHAAPHLLVDSTGKHHLIWVSRNNPQDTISCVVLADAARLLTNTLPKRDLCASGSGSSLTMVEFDMFATSPLPTEVPGAQDHIYATGISAQMTVDNSLSFCSRSASRVIDYDDPTNDDRAKCQTFRDEAVAKGAALGAFQNFAVVRPGQQIYFARDIEQRTDSLLMDLWQRVRGNTYSPGGTMLAIELLPPATPRGPLVANLQKMVRFSIDDRFDPMVPISRRKNDLRFLSLEASKSAVHVRMIDFAKDEPAVTGLRLTTNGNDVDLHKSWASRPMLVVETKEAQPKTRLIFSRGELATEPGKTVEPSANSEALTLETLVFERDAAAPADAPFVRTGGATCTVTYAFRTNTDFPCYRAFDPKRPMRASPAARMQTSQLLVGHFAGHGGQALAFPDFCRRTEPIILAPKGDTFLPTIASVGEQFLTRKVTCSPLNAPADISAPIRPGAAATGSSAG
jgi:hypothetical protein